MTTRADYCPRCDRVTVQQVVLSEHGWSLWCPECHCVIAAGSDEPVRITQHAGTIIAGGQHDDGE